MSTPNPSLNDPSVAASGLPKLGAQRVWTHWRSLARIGQALRAETADLHVRMTLANLVVSLLPSHSFCRTRTGIYRLSGLHIGSRSLIFGRIQFTGSGSLQRRLRIGSDTMINCNFFVDLNADISIGNHVSIGHHVALITAEHDIGPARCRAGAMKPLGISIEDGCWLGARSTVLPGCRIGRSTVVAAGSLIAGHVPANKLVGGVPARALRSLPSEP